MTTESFCSDILRAITICGSAKCAEVVRRYPYRRAIATVKKYARKEREEATRKRNFTNILTKVGAK